MSAPLVADKKNGEIELQILCFSKGSHVEIRSLHEGLFSLLQTVQILMKYRLLSVSTMLQKYMFTDFQDINGHLTLESMAHIS